MSRRRQRYEDWFPPAPPINPYFGYGAPEALEIPEVIQRYQYLQQYFKGEAEKLDKLLKEAAEKEKTKAKEGRKFTALEQFQMILIASAGLGYIWYKLLS